MKRREDLLKKFSETRRQTEYICEHLEVEDMVVQPTSEVSPPKWHLAHTTWFFEQFILVNYYSQYEVFDADFAFLFNSYYNNMGERSNRDRRGYMTRPIVKEVLSYRQYVTEHVVDLLSKTENEDVFSLAEIGINHEQQHQELLAYDIKYILGTQPTYPAIGELLPLTDTGGPSGWKTFSEGIYDIGNDGQTFCFDNEQPRHKRYINDFTISTKLVTNEAFIEFIEDGGYENFNFWHDEGWHFIQDNKISSPLYWQKKKGSWWTYTFEGLKPLKLDEPVMHISYYEAFAYAEWKGMRLPTEFEWEVAAPSIDYGQLWEWTGSAYLPYPGFQKAEGALGEYNGKFMINQNVLRGGSVATPKGHIRKTYRNFFHASSRWIFSGFRLVKS